MTIFSKLLQTAILMGFREQSDGDIFGVMDNLAIQAPHLTRAALSKKEVAIGFNFNPSGLLLDKLAREVLTTITLFA